MAHWLGYRAAGMVRVLTALTALVEANAGAQTSRSRVPAIRVSGASVRVATGAPDVGAGYLTLTNSSAVRVVIKGFDCEGVRTVRLHVSREQGGVMRMERLDSIEIAPGGTLRLQAGGVHLMLEGPHRSFRSGELLTCTLLESDRSTVTWLAAVRAP